MTEQINGIAKRQKILSCNRCSGTGNKKGLLCVSCGGNGQLIREVEIKEDRQIRMAMIAKRYTKKRTESRRRSRKIRAAIEKSVNGLTWFELIDIEMAKERES